MRKNMGKWWCSEIFYSKILFQLQPWYVSTYAWKTSGNGNPFSFPRHSKTEFRFRFQDTPKQNSVSVSETLQNRIPFPFPRHSETEFHFRFWITLLYKPQHTPVVQWYSSLCQQLDLALAVGHRDTTLVIHVTLLSNCLVGLLANTDHIVLGFCTAYSAHDVISKKIKWLPCKGFVIKSATIFLVGHHPMLISFMFTQSVMKKYWMLICLVRLLVKALPFCSNRIELLLSCSSKLSTIPYPCDNRK